MDDLNTATESVKVGLSLLGESIGLIKKAKNIMPDSRDKQVIERSLDEANKAAKVA